MEREAADEINQAIAFAESASANRWKT